MIYNNVTHFHNLCKSRKTKQKRFDTAACCTIETILLKVCVKLLDSFFKIMITVVVRYFSRNLWTTRMYPNLWVLFLHWADLKQRHRFFFTLWRLSLTLNTISRPVVTHVFNKYNSHILFQGSKLWFCNCVSLSLKLLVSKTTLRTTKDNTKYAQNEIKKYLNSQHNFEFEFVTAPIIIFLPLGLSCVIKCIIKTLSRTGDLNILINKSK